MNEELKVYLEGMEARIVEGLDNRFDEQAELTSKAFTSLERHIDERFDRIENKLLARHDTQIERLVDDVRVLKTKLGIA